MSGKIKLSSWTKIFSVKKISKNRSAYINCMSRVCLTVVALMPSPQTNMMTLVVASISFSQFMANKKK